LILEHPNDIIAKKDRLGWKCGNFQDGEIEDRIIRIIPNSEHAKEIIAERKKKGILTR
jgi:hypothetical protein